MCILGEPTEGKVVLGHFGSLWLRISTQGNFIHTAFSEGKRDQNSILRMREVLDAVLEWIPTWEDDPENAYRGATAIVNVGAIAGRLRLARLAHAAPHRPLPRRPRAADEADGGRARRRCMDMVRGLARALPGLRHRGRGLRDRARRRDRRGPPAGRRDRRGARGGVRRAARARRDALVLGCLGADALRRRRPSTTARRPG